MSENPFGPRPGAGPEDDERTIAVDVALVSRIGSVPAMLEIICQNTGMRFAAVARVTDGTWTACAVRDGIGFGIEPGGQLDVETTLCKEARAARLPVAFDQASLDPQYRNHHTPRIYGIESYVSVPIVLASGRYFGNLCAIDPRPAKVSSAPVIAMFEAFAKLVAMELEREIREEAREAELVSEKASSRLREEFIAVLGHDLRGPLAAVSACGDLLVHKGAAVNVEATGWRIKSSVGRMSRLIDDVLDFARGRLGGGIDLRMTSDDKSLAAGLLAVVHETRQAHPEASVEEQIDIAAVTTSDVGRLQQLLSNLLGNALHHGARDRPVRVAATVTGREVVVSVTNDGQTLDPLHLQRLFEPYWRPPTSLPGGGLGLGLHICSQIAAAHGGRMAVESSDDGVTTFSAHLPILAQRSPETPA